MKNNLDERQEQTLLKIEHTGCWLAFWGLMLAMIVQTLLSGFDFHVIAGEWIVFMALSVYLCFACLRAGIWDRRLRANLKTNLLVSLITAALFGGIVFAVTLSRYTDKPIGAAASGGISAAVVFVLCFLALSIAAHCYKKRKKALEKEPEDEL